MVVGRKRIVPGTQHALHLLLCLHLILLMSVKLLKLRKSMKYSTNTLHLKDLQPFKSMLELVDWWLGRNRIAPGTQHSPIHNKHIETLQAIPQKTCIKNYPSIEPQQPMIFELCGY